MEEKEEEEEEESFPELVELKRYFSMIEQKEEEEDDTFYNDNEEIGKLSFEDIHAGGESDFSEDFEKAIRSTSPQRLPYNVSP